jgi:LmbE family N-acetylglucosaminyl deacetylase
MQTPFDPGSLPRHVLGVWAHPDDEAYLSAGLMARMRDAGRDVTVLTLTRGEKGTADPAHHDQAHFAELREAELRASLAELGVHDLRMHDYRDGACHLVPAEQGIGVIEDVIRRVRPDVVVTFGPDGITGHADHRAVSSWTTEAWRRAGTGELLYATMTDGFVGLHAEVHDRLGMFGEFGLDAPVSVPEDRVAWQHELSEGELDRKRRALARHASQTEALATLMGEETYRTWWRTESFRRPTADELASCPLVTERAAVRPVAAAA